MSSAPGRASLRSRRPELLAGLSGLVFAASTPPIDFTPGILLGMTLFAWSLGSVRTPSVRSAAWRGALFGFAANLEALRFVPEVLARFTPLPTALNGLALVLLAAAQSLPWAAGGAVARRLASTARVPGWLAFATGIYVATFLPCIFPWTPAGGLSAWPVLLQTAELVGERGTSFLLATGCGLLAEAVTHLVVRGRAMRLGGLSVAVFAVLLAYGALRVRAVEALRASAPTARIALVQPDFDASFRWDASRSMAMMRRLTEATKQAEAAGAELTVWPESAYPYTLPHGTSRSPYGPRAVLQHGVRGPVLTGAYLTRPDGSGTNSAILVEQDGAIGPSYDKRHLLWFGETVPLADVFPVLRRVFARGTGLVPGDASVAFEPRPVAATRAGGGAIAAAVLDCYEDTLPVAGREAMAVHPNVLVNITNDAWFAGSAEGELHLRLAVLRAIEARRDLVRAVNRGPTTWVDASGRVRGRRDPGGARGAGSEGAGQAPPALSTHVLLADAALLDGPPTLYARAGDGPLAALLGTSLALGAYRARRRDQAHKSAAGAVR